MLFTKTHFSVTSISLLEDLLGNHTLNSHLLQRGKRPLRRGTEEREEGGEGWGWWEV